MGRPQSLPTKCYPQAIAVALALRHSWRREALLKFARRLGLRVAAKDLRDSQVAVDDSSPDTEPVQDSAETLQ